MEVRFLQYYKPQVLLGLIVVLSLGIYATKEYLPFQVSLTSIIVLILMIINTKLWNRKLFSWMFWFDDFSGTYEGLLQYQYYDRDGNEQIGQLKHRKVIKQTGSTICVSSFTFKEDGTKSSLSISKGVYLDKFDDGHYRLIYHYLNDGNQKQKFSPHYGTDVLKFIKKDDGETLMSGNYYTNRLPSQTKGEYVELKKINNNQNHEE